LVCKEVHIRCNLHFVWPVTIVSLSIACQL
jgi:hypothetical protein